MTRYMETRTGDDDLCWHCGVYVKCPNPPHAWTCPMLTDIWAVTEREISEDMVCMSCGHVFEIGDFYTGKDVTCLTCAAEAAA